LKNTGTFCSTDLTTRPPPIFHWVQAALNRTEAIAQIHKTNENEQKFAL